MRLFQQNDRASLRHAAFVMVFGLLGVLAGCGGGGGGASDKPAPQTPTSTPTPNTPATLKSIEVTPSAAQVAAGTSRQFTATGVYSDNSKQDLTTQVTWASSDTAVATVSNTAGSHGLASTSSVGATTVSATSGAVSGSTTLTVTAATLVSLQVTPPAPSVTRGSTQQFTATGVFSDHSTQDLTAQVTWTSSNAAVATVSNAPGSNGLASTVGVGSTTVSASSGAVSASATLTVTAATLVSLEVTPATSSITNGSTLQFTATGVFSDHSTQNLTTQVTWSSSDTAVATVGSNGLASTAGVGGTTVSASSGGISGSTSLTVTAATLDSIEVTPTASSITHGSTQQFTATGVFSDGSTQDLTSTVTWASSDPAVATVSNAADSSGLATTTGVGNTKVSATSGSVVGITTLTVTAATLVSLEVTPHAPSITHGSTEAFTATGVFSDGSTQDLTTAVTWESSDKTVATVSNAAGSNGVASSAGVGSTTISATSGAISASTTLTVTAATLVSLAVSPTDPSIAHGTTQQFTVTGSFSDGSTQDLTAAVTWASSDPAVASVSNADGSNGLASTAGTGSTTVSATSGTVSGSTTLTVTAATLESIKVTPSDPSIAHGTTQQFTATGRYSDGSEQDLTTAVTWGSSDPAVAAVSNADGSIGLASTAGVGNTTVSASSGSVSGSTTLTVTAAKLLSLEVTPADASITLGDTQQFTVTGVYSDNSTQDLTGLVTWGSSNTAVATVSNAEGSNGLAGTAGVGTTTVSATSGTVSGSATLTVTPATLVSINVTPLAPSILRGWTQQFMATGLYSDNSVVDMTTQVVWGSSNLAVATVSNAGLVSTVDVGSTTVSATSGAVSGSTTLTVTGAYPSVVDQQLAALLIKVTGVGSGHSLFDKVEEVQAFLAVPNIISACNTLNTFKGNVAAQSGKKDLDPAFAAELLADADTIRAAIPCP